MKYSFTEEAFRKLICSIKDRINNHRHKVADVEDLSELTEDDIKEICDFEEGMNDENVIPKASADLLGCVKVGDRLSVDEDGKLTATTGLWYDSQWQQASIPSASYGLIATVKVPPGEYLVYSHMDYNTHSTAVYNHLIEAIKSDGTTVYQRVVRNSMNSGGGSINMHTMVLDTESTIRLRSYNAHSAACTGRGNVTAIKIK